MFGFFAGKNDDQGDEGKKNHRDDGKALEQSVDDHLRIIVGGCAGAPCGGVGGGQYGVAFDFDGGEALENRADVLIVIDGFEQGFCDELLELLVHFGAAVGLDSGDFGERGAVDEFRLDGQGGIDEAVFIAAHPGFGGEGDFGGDLAVLDLADEEFPLVWLKDLEARNGEVHLAGVEADGAALFVFYLLSEPKQFLPEFLLGDFQAAGVDCLNHSGAFIGEGFDHIPGLKIGPDEEGEHAGCDESGDDED